MFYIACPTTHRGMALEYGERRRGDPRDAYEQFGDCLQRGYRAFRAVELTHAYWPVPPAPAALSSSTRA